MDVAGDKEGGALAPCIGKMYAVALEVPVASLVGELASRVRTIMGGLGEADRRGDEMGRCNRGDMGVWQGLDAGACGAKRE